MKPAVSPGAALVTGGASGLGRAICRRLAARGDHVTVADLDLVGARETVELVVAAGGSAAAEELDVADVEAVAATIARVDDEQVLGTVVNNAAVASITPLLSADMAAFDRTFAVNVRGAYAVLRAAATAMVPRGCGSVVNICSTSSFTASSTAMIAYDMSKAAMAMMTAAAAKELGPTGVRVNGVAPGTMDTPLVRGLIAAEDLTHLAADRIPLGLLGSTEEVAHAVAFLSSSEASYVTGHVLVVDGGWLA